MRKIKNILLLGVLFIVGFTYNVQADSIKYYLSNSDNNYEYVSKDDVKTINVKKGDVIHVFSIVDNDYSTPVRISNAKITIHWDDKFLAIQDTSGRPYNIITDGVSVTGISPGSYSKDTNKLTITGLSAVGSLKDGKSKVVEFIFRVLDTASGETKIYQTAGDDTLECVYSSAGGSSSTPIESFKCGESLYSEIKYSVSKSTENRLAGIKINGENIANFNEDTTEYNVEVASDVDKAVIEVSKKDTSSKISGNYGSNKLDYGKNTFTINVISESESRKTYTINITRKDDRSSINTLKTLTVSTGDINFKPEVTEYNINVENSVDTITITSSLTDEKSKYVEDYRNKEITLNEGSNKIQIKVISEKNEEKVYTLNINRALNSNNSLKSLMVNDEKIKLNEDEFIYSMTVENDVDEVVIKAIANSENATVDLKDKYPLEIGDNEIQITVSAANGDKALYTLNITRKKILSKDGLLKDLKIKGYDINFKQDVTLYNLKINDNDDQLDIVYITEDENAKVEIEGNKNLEDGSIVKINVKAEDGTYTRYFINIEKGSSGISPVIIIIIILFLLLAIIMTVLFLRKKKVKEKKEFSELNKPNEPVKEEVKEEVNAPVEEEKEVPKDEPKITKEVSEEETPVELPKEEPEIPSQDIPEPVSEETGENDYEPKHELHEESSEPQEEKKTLDEEPIEEKKEDIE